MVSLSIENLMKTENPILYRILQYLDYESLESFSLAITNTYLWNSLNISFDLERKLKPWEHHKRQSPLRLYWGYQSYDINYSNLRFDRCRCKYCLVLICCVYCWYDWCCYFCDYYSVCSYCDYKNKLFRTTSYARRYITLVRKYRRLYKRPYTRSISNGTTKIK